MMSLSEQEKTDQLASDARFIRQQDIVPAESLRSCRVTVIGTGAIGRQVAIQLAAMGVSHLQLVDFDTVEIENLASQGFWETDLGSFKVDAVGLMCLQINRSIDIHLENTRFRRSLSVGDCIFCCVDSIEVRRMIWESVKDKVRFFCDGRMTAEVLRVITCTTSTGFGGYEKTLFTADQAYRGACTSKSTIFCSNIAAGMMLSQFTKYLRRLPVEQDLTLNLLSAELTVTDQ